MADEKPAEHAGEVAEKSPGALNRVVMITSLVNMVATGGIIAVLFMSYVKEKSQPTIEDILRGQAAKAKSEAEAAQWTKKVGGGEQGGEAAGGVGATEAGTMIALDPFVVNLTTGVGTSPRFVRLNASVELERGAPDKEFGVKTARVRDTVINLLNAKKPGELNSVEGREQLKEEIRRSINAFMLQSKVRGVYFTNFSISN